MSLGIKNSEQASKASNIHLHTAIELGTQSIARGEFDQAVAHFGRANECAGRLGNGPLIWQTFLYLADAQRRTRRYAEAKESAESAMRIAEDLRSPRWHQAFALAEIALCSIEENDTDAAVELLEVAVESLWKNRKRADRKYNEVFLMLCYCYWLRADWYKLRKLGEYTLRLCIDTAGIDHADSDMAEDLLECADEAIEEERLTGKRSYPLIEDPTIPFRR